MGHLHKTKAYLIGAMEFGNENCISWREHMERELTGVGIICFNPYNKPFLHTFAEGEKERQQYQELRKTGQYDELSKIFREVRVYDLNCVDRSDFVIFYYNPAYPTVGSWEEFYWANRLKKPIFFISATGKENAPMWVFGTIPHKYIYNSVEDVISMLKKIDSGEKTMDSGRWRILKPEFR